MDIGKGNYETEYYVCAIMNHDLGCYDSELRKNNIDPILYGHMFFADFSHLCPPNLPDCIVEIHGLGPGWVNVGIYTDDLDNIPDNAKIRMVFKHIGNARFEWVS